MIILDTNVVSALMYRIPEPVIVHWYDKQPASSLWITSVTLFEIRFGIEILVPGKRKQTLLREFEGFLHDVGGRVAVLDSDAAEKAAELMALRQKRGRPSEVRDTMIAGIALANNASIATRNVNHFEDLSVPILNPWKL